jgi:hypothetical protein
VISFSGVVWPMRGGEAPDSLVLIEGCGLGLTMGIKLVASYYHHLVVQRRVSLYTLPSLYDSCGVTPL